MLGPAQMCNGAVYVLWCEDLGKDLLQQAGVLHLAGIGGSNTVLGDVFLLGTFQGVSAA